MKSSHLPYGVGLTLLLAGCSTTPLALAPVGPSPAVVESAASEGQLQVFSRMRGRSEGNNPPWYQHSDYTIYDLQGKVVERVHNTTGHYAKAPCLVALPTGSSLVKAKASDYFWVDVPVTIKRGRTTEVHLDNKWQIPGEASTKELVSLPNGHPVGWREAAAKDNVVN